MTTAILLVSPSDQATVVLFLAVWFLVVAFLVFGQYCFRCGLSDRDGDDDGSSADCP